MMAAAWTKNNQYIESLIIQTTSDSHRSHYNVLVVHSFQHAALQHLRHDLDLASPAYVVTLVKRC